MLVLLLAPEDLDEELVAIFVHAEAQGLWVFQKLRENGVCVAKGGRVDIIILEVALHQIIQFPEELKL